MQHFNELAISETLLERLEAINFTTPTPIQAKAIPPALEGRDILGSAQTGTGKTGAYGIPLVEQLLNNKRGTALVLLPTRELAVQVMKALKDFIGRSKISTALLIGGEPMPKQFSQLRSNPRLIVGTPGRINDHLERGMLKLHDTRFLVLDEVDRMLDMGFGIQLDAIARFLTAPNRQTLMFSATLPKTIENVAAKYLTLPVRVSVGADHAPATKIKQMQIKLSPHEKYSTLVDELNARSGSVIIFVKTKRGADNIADKLYKAGFRANALHGDLRQNKRNQVIAGFRKSHYRILVATDVAARGLDIPHIEHVINYDLPQCPEDYVHRIGRTARAGAEGEAVNFLAPADAGKWREIQRLIDPDAKPEPFEKSGSKKKRPNKNRRHRQDNRGQKTQSNENRKSSEDRKHNGENRRHNENRKRNGENRRHNEDRKYNGENRGHNEDRKYNGENRGHNEDRKRNGENHKHNENKSSKKQHSQDKAKHEGQGRKNKFGGQEQAKSPNKRRKLFSGWRRKSSKVA